MAEPIIRVSDLTKDYGYGRGVFDVSFEVQPGEVFGYLGTNGSGKTTTIRHMMGFLKQDQGTVEVNGLDPWTQAPELMKSVGYVPGEIAFPSVPTGMDFFKVQCEYLEIKDTTRMYELLDLMELDATANLKRMSKGMKQKTAVVEAFMADRPILILDEPTTGLDPLMRENFLELVREEKAKGHTVFMSSHIFEEIEDVCDRVGIIQDGLLREIISLSELHDTSPRKFTLDFATPEDAAAFAEAWPGSECENATVRCSVLPQDIDAMFHTLGERPVESVHETHIDLAEYFMEKYGKERNPWKRK